MKLNDVASRTAPLTVRPFLDGDRAAWSAFVDACADATFFHRIEWRSIIEQVFGHHAHYLIAEREGQIAGVLPLAQIDSLLFGRSLVSLPFAVYGGAAVLDEYARHSLHEAAADLTRKLNVDHLELRNRGRFEPQWAEQQLYVTFRKPIVADHEANMQAIPRKQRAMVRKAMQRGLASVVDGDVNRFFDLYADNAHRHGTPPFSKRYFESLLRAFGPQCEVMTVVAPSGAPVSSVLSFYFRDEVLPYYAGDVTDARDLAANDFKYWELMRRAADRGCRVFDYGRSKRDSGSFAFKKNWGFERQPLHYEYKLLKRDRIPQNNPANPKYQAMIKIWRRMPRPLVNAIGPSIVRNLG